MRIIWIISFTIIIQYTTIAEITVNLRIEGDENTIFESCVVTEDNNVTTISGGTHTCDGTNNNASLIAGPTITNALDSASKIKGFTWDGIFYESFDDYFITRIDNTSQTNSKYWSILLNYNFTSVGGCQQKVKENEYVLFAFDAFNKVHFLKLEASHKTVKIGRPTIITVTDGATGKPISGATVENKITNRHGHAVIILKKLGLQRIKAERSDSIRSNSVMVYVTN